MYSIDEMISILNEWGYIPDFYGSECDIYFLGSCYIDTVYGEYGLYNWMCDRDML